MFPTAKLHIIKMIQAEVLGHTSHDRTRTLKLRPRGDRYDASEKVSITIQKEGVIENGKGGYETKFYNNVVIHCEVPITTSTQTFIN